MLVFFSRLFNESFRIKILRGLMTDKLERIWMERASLNQDTLPEFAWSNRGKSQEPSQPA
jgi:hypothetical protein